MRLRRAATSVVLILVVALCLRAAFLWNYASHNPHQALATIPFLFESGNIATALATGHGFSSPFRVDTGPTAWTTPVYPLLLAGIFRIFGTYTFSAYLAACALNMVATALACVPIFYAGKRIGGVAIGATAAWLWAVFPNAVMIPSTSMWDASLAALLSAVILWATIAFGGQSIAPENAIARAAKMRGWKVIPEANAQDERRDDPLLPWIGYGLLWGVALMTTATLVGLLPFLVGWIVYRRRRRFGARGVRSLRGPAIALALTALCCVPWTVRNYEAFHAFVPMRSILGLQLWVGNNPQAKAIWLGTQHPIHDSAERAKYVEMGEIAYMKEKERNALGYIATHPAREGYLIWRRFLEFWSGGTPAPIDDLLRSRSAWFDFVLLFNLLIALGAAVGTVVMIRRQSAYWFPLAVSLVVFPWAYYLTVVMPRYSLPVEPAAMLLGSAAIWGVRRQNAGSRLNVVPGRAHMATR